MGFFCYMAEVLMIWRKTLSNQSVIFSCFREVLKLGVMNVLINVNVQEEYEKSDTLKIEI